LVVITAKVIATRGGITLYHPTIVPSSNSTFGKNNFKEIHIARKIGTHINAFSLMLKISSRGWESNVINHLMDFRYIII